MHPWTSMLALILAGEAIFALPFVLVRIFRPTVLEVFDINNTQLGAIFSFYGVVALLSYFPGGPLADRFPARKLMVAALLLTATGGLGYATLPDVNGLRLLYGWFGLTTILLFWAALLRATREWGGSDAQGRAYGLLDGGRGLVAALLASVSVALFAVMLPDAENIDLAAKASALRSTILYFTAGTAFAAVVVWFGVTEPEATEARPRLEWSQIGSVLKMPTLWLQAVIVVCAYIAYKGTDDFSLLASDALGYDDVQAASVGTLSFWVRPFAAVAAGLLADRLGGSRVLMGSFALLFVCNLAVIGTADLGLAPVLVSAVLATSVFVFGLRGVYFAIFDEAKVPLHATGTAVGVVSVIGYTPDIFMGPLMGMILDGNPGVLGHQYLFGLLAVAAALGGLATWGFRWVAGSSR
ncbi:MAG: MFS transporter [Myxococcales bacterium]|nr:MFS transporter [Myxococcales bacterium]